MARSSLIRPATYPRASDVRRAILVAQRSGLDIASLEIRPDGTIRLGSANAEPSKAPSDFDLWEARGSL